MQVQLSDGQLDYVIDALAVHDHMHLLQPLLSDPDVLKVGEPECLHLPWFQACTVIESMCSGL